MKVGSDRGLGRVLLVSLGSLSIGCSSPSLTREPLLELQPKAVVSVAEKDWKAVSGSVVDSLFSLGKVELGAYVGSLVRKMAAGSQNAGGDAKEAAENAVWLVENTRWYPQQVTDTLRGYFEKVGTSDRSILSFFDAVEDMRTAGLAAVDGATLRDYLAIYIIEDGVFRKTNEMRRCELLKELTWNHELAKIARAHSRDMAANAYFSHVNGRGQNPSDRADATGFNIRKDGTVGVGENIGEIGGDSIATYGVDSIYVHRISDEEFAAWFVDNWMHSPGHRANILRGGYDSVGIGVARDKKGLHYATQDFF